MRRCDLCSNHPPDTSPAPASPLLADPRIYSESDSTRRQGLAPDNRPHAYAASESLRRRLFLHLTCTLGHLAIAIQCHHRRPPASPPPPPHVERGIIGPAKWATAHPKTTAPRALLRGRVTRNVSLQPSRPTDLHPVQYRLRRNPSQGRPKCTAVEAGVGAEAISLFSAWVVIETPSRHPRGRERPSKSARRGRRRRRGRRE